MYLSQLQLSGFRQFGTGDASLALAFNRGVTALIGRNDSGKSAIIDSVRYALLTRDQSYIRVQPEDFHVDASGEASDTFEIVCRLSDLSVSERAAFAEYLSYSAGEIDLYVHFKARRISASAGARRWVNVEVRTGKDGLGPSFDGSVRELLAAAYLRPLRDAERELSAGRGSRLSQILYHVPEVKAGTRFDATSPLAALSELDTLSLIGLADYFSSRVKGHDGVQKAATAINDDYLKELLLAGEPVFGRIDLTEGGTEDARLRQILERLELTLGAGVGQVSRGRFGLGSNNLLYMACELLLLGREPDGLPLLLIEEPEAHVHPQRQLRLMSFLRDAAEGGEDRRPVQVLLSTHSPNLASGLPVANTVLLDGKTAHALAPDQTKLSPGDYSFLERFLDVTKANLFFAHGLLIVEGDAEALLLPAIAKAIGLDLAAQGVSIVNVGHTGLRRFARIFQRADENATPPDMPVACLADFDVMPDRAPEALGLVTCDTDPKWESSKRRWKAKRDFKDENGNADAKLAQRRDHIRRDDGQMVRTFVADHWTLEYDLARCGLAALVHRAAQFAINHEKICEGRTSRESIVTEVGASFAQLEADHTGDPEMLAILVYDDFKNGSASKAIAAQYLAEEIDKVSGNEAFNPETFASSLPGYLVEAIRHACGKGKPLSKGEPAGASK